MKRFDLPPRVLVGMLLLLCAAAVCRADGLIIIQNESLRPLPGNFAFAPLEITYHHVSVDIVDQVATTTVDQDFYNPNPRQLEGTYLFPLPAGSHIDKFSMDIGGTMTDAELLPADRARSIYEEIVRKYRDPALLEYVGRDAFKVRIFPILGNSHKKIKLSYTQLLKSEGGLVEYSYPMNTEKFSAKLLESVSVRINLASKDPLKSIYSPTHTVDIRRDGEHRAVIGYEQTHVRPDADFKLVFSRSKQAVGVDLLTYRQSGEDGYFLLLASPGLEAPRGAVQQKDVCFILDTSGSMAGPKIEQAKKALSFCVNSLNEGDGFEIIRFSTECEPLFNELRPASHENVDKALGFVKDLRAVGGTAIEDALHQALTMKHHPDRPFVVVFLTDGMPTIGETNEDALVNQVANLSHDNTRVFCFGIGNDVNTHLLDRIADGTRAFATYVAPEEDIEVKVSNFFTGIKEPALSNVQLSFTGDAIRTHQMYPSQIPDLFKGEMLTAFGRYSGHGPAAVKITGTINGQPQTFVTDVSFCDNDTSHAFIPRLWATRRVGYLLDQIRMHGDSRELVDEITRLAREHGIVTPYTAYLILEDERSRHVPLERQNFRELGMDDRVRGGAEERVLQATSEAKDESTRSGRRAADAARDVGALKQNANLDALQNAEQNAALSKGTADPKLATATPAHAASGGPAEPSAAGAGAAGSGAADPGASGPGAQGQTSAAAPAVDGYRVSRNYAQQARVINGRAFYQNGTIWTDSTAQSNATLKQQQIAFNSDAYFDLLRRHPEAAAWLSLGAEVDLVLDDTLYSVR